MEKGCTELFKSLIFPIFDYCAMICISRQLGQINDSQDCVKQFLRTINFGINLTVYKLFTGLHRSEYFVSDTVSVSVAGNTRSISSLLAHPPPIKSLNNLRNGISTGHADGSFVFIVHKFWNVLPFAPEALATLPSFPVYLENVDWSLTSLYGTNFHGRTSVFSYPRHTCQCQTIN